MNRSDLIEQVSMQLHLPTAEVEKILTKAFCAIETALAAGDNVVLKNFGRFETRDRAPTVRRNPISGIDIKVPRKRGVLFKASPALKRNVQREE